MPSSSGAFVKVARRASSEGIDPASAGSHQIGISEQFAKRFDTGWQRAARDSPYKLIERHDGSRELYDLGTDALETRNLLRGSLTSGQRSALDRLDRRIGASLATHGS
ncbi:MAG: hypothetical protein AB7I59_08575 [Geminicoccaceae bacterium]